MPSTNTEQLTWRTWLLLVAVMFLGFGLGAIRRRWFRFFGPPKMYMVVDFPWFVQIGKQRFNVKLVDHPGNPDRVGGVKLLGKIPVWEMEPGKLPALTKWEDGEVELTREEIDALAAKRFNAPVVIFRACIERFLETYPGMGNKLNTEVRDGRLYVNGTPL